MNERDAYVEKMKAKLDEWNAELDRLSAKMSAAEADANLEYQKTKKENKAIFRRAWSKTSPCPLGR